MVIRLKKMFFLYVCLSLISPQIILAQEKSYSYEQLGTDLKKVQQLYGVQVYSIGKSEKGRHIWAAKLGRGKQHILLVGAHHAREWLTSAVLMKMLEEYSEAYMSKTNIGKYATHHLDDVSIWFVPMLNPDGVAIQQRDFRGLSNLEKVYLLQMNDYSTNWSRWKANAMGIDLNRQYPAGWQEVKTDVYHPYYQFYKGRKPFEAAEVQALVNFTRKIQPLVAVSYHTSGREIFWKYYNEPNLIQRDYHLAKETAKLTKYKITTPESHAVGSGFSDWFITEFHRPAITLELGYLVEETNPPYSVFAEEWRRNRFVGMMLVEEVRKMYKNNDFLHTKGKSS